MRVWCKSATTMGGHEEVELFSHESVGKIRGSCGMREHEAPIVVPDKATEGLGFGVYLTLW